MNEQTFEQLYEALERLLTSPFTSKTIREAVNNGDVMEVAEILEKTLEYSDLFVFSSRDLQEIEADAVKDHIHQSNTGSY